MSDLPIARSSPFTRPFSYMGIDFLGPLTVAKRRRAEERWVSLFTCLTVRAVHLEEAYSLSTDSFIMCLRNVMARSGTPIEIRCDNGRNFKGYKKSSYRCIQKYKKLWQISSRFLIHLWELGAIDSLNKKFFVKNNVNKKSEWRTSTNGGSWLYALWIDFIVARIQSYKTIAKTTV